MTAPQSSADGRHREARRDDRLRVLVLEAGSYATPDLDAAGATPRLTVERARDPDELIRRLRTAAPDVIVVSLPIPQTEPDQLHREIVAVDPELAHRLVFLAQDLPDPAARRFLAEAGRPFLTRPVDRRALSELVRRVGLNGGDGDG